MLESFSQGVVCLDLELTRQGRLHRIGALWPARGEVFERQGRFDLDGALRDLDAFCRGARLVLGHNLIDHDLNALTQLAPALRLLHLPVIDTLLLSPLAFPENPYHHLVKDYRLVRDSVSDPVADCRLAWRVFTDQWAAFSEADRRLLRFYAHCFEDFGSDFGGTTAVFTELAEAPPLSAEGAAELFIEEGRGSTCAWAVDQLRDELQEGSPPALAYAVAWLRVAGGTSVLPPWVRHRFTDLPRLLDRLRQPALGERCGERRDCGFCRGGVGARHELQRFFGFDDFRPEPSGDDGTSLQKVAVEHGLAHRPHLGVLATGAGKSICYQLPALVHYFRRGQLTVVISPLQALMKDQVENLNRRTGTEQAAALYGLLTPPERGQVLERVRLGSVALLYVAPEQLRNRSFERTIAHREIAAWIYDEAHCLSKWGHDFRPDYLYAARFIRELAARQRRDPPPVGCYTATAKHEVVDEIREHFRVELGQELAFFGSAVERQELTFLVEAVAPQEKVPRMVQLLRQHLPEAGSAVIYFASRRATLRAAGALIEQGIEAAAFHAGLEAPEKRRVLEAFTAGELRVVCATNAFGMGIDKDDVRLVIHADIPGSLESYLQEAGRAGRDRRSSLCVLFYDEHDVERQFKMVAGSRLSQRDIAQLLKGVRRAVARHGQRGEPRVALTSGELVRDEEVDIALAPDDWGADTRVKSAIAWLERAGFLRRLHNRTRVFQGRLRIDDLQQAKALINALPADRRPGREERRRWLSMLGALINADPSRGLTADELAELPSMDWSEAQRPEAGQRVLRGLSDMAEAGLLSAGLQLAAYVRPRGKDNARALLEVVARTERAMLEELEAADPDAERGEWRELSLRLLNQRLLDRGLECRPQQLRRLLRSLSEDGKGLAGRQGSLEMRYRSRDRYRISLLREWPALRELAERRRQVANVVLGAFLDRADQKAKGLLLVELAMEDLVADLRRDLALRQMLRDPLAAAERGLLFLHEQGVLQLQNGLAVFRQAMTLELAEGSKGRRYARRDYQPLEVHYGERTFQVHAMARYAELGLEKLQEALHLVRDYFAARRDLFTKAWFPDEGDELARATGPRSYQRIVDDLGNPRQAALVTAPADANLLILAGPGSGKTRVVVHRCAYLLRVLRVPPRSLLVLCFNRNASLELRRRLRDLVGEDAHGVTVCTYHGLAMRLLGRSFATEAHVAETDLAQIIPEAVELLRREDGENAPESLRDDLLAGFGHILVDEYQDIDRHQYELISEVTGRRRPGGDRENGSLAILAVGDDDQTIYGWNGARVEFIRRFREDYGAEEHLLIENYRSSRHILEAAQEVIRTLPDRLKSHHTLDVDSARRHDPPGGLWAKIDPQGAGRVRLIEPWNAFEQARALAGWLQGLRRLDPGLSWTDCAILARRRDVLMPVRAALEDLGIPVSWAADREALPPPVRIRELRRLLEHLRELRHTPVRASELQAQSSDVCGPWGELLDIVLAEWRQESDDRPAEARAVAEFLYESLAERRRSAALGAGVLLSTVHAAKGLEFAHVALPDGGWGQQSDPEAQAEECRLYYVGMTRAKSSLLLAALGGRHPYTPRLANLDLDRRPIDLDGLRQPSTAALRRRFDIVGLEDLFLSYAGQAPPTAPIHRHLREMATGDPVEIRPIGDRLAVCDRGGHRVAMLSAKGCDRLRPHLDRLHTARVLALVERRAEDSEPAYRRSLATERWEVPVLEVVWS